MVFKNGSVFIDGTFHTLDVKVQDGLITQIGEALSDEQAIDIRGKLLLPGFIDIHTHGCMGFEFYDANERQMAQMCRFYAKNGVTSVLATTITAPFERLKESVTTIRNAAKGGLEHHILGINLEGPFLGKDKRGAHDPEHLLPIDPEKFEALDRLAGGMIRIVDIDPCLDGAMDFIRTYSKGKTVSLAHTGCDYTLAGQAIRAGANHITHLFNAMNPLHHRNPGLIGALSDYNVRAELIADGIHVHPSVIRLIYKVAGEKLILISDSMRATGLSDGEYVLGDLKVFVKNGKATLSDGTIAGSTTTLFQAVKNAISFGIPMAAAITSASLLPATAIGMEQLLGSIHIGKRADLLVVAPAFELLEVYKGGDPIH